MFVVKRCNINKCTSAGPNSCLRNLSTKTQNTAPEPACVNMDGTIAVNRVLVCAIEDNLKQFEGNGRETNRVLCIDVVVVVVVVVPTDGATAVMGVSIILDGIIGVLSVVVCTAEVKLGELTKTASN